MHLFLIGGLLLIGLFVAEKSKAADGSFDISTDEENVPEKLYGLVDILPADQGGNFKKDFDYIMESDSVKTGVPFGLIKAHAFVESSLNARAFRDENPDKKASRTGWASRGLMQLLFWPGSTRFEQYGYDSDDLSGGDDLFDPLINIDIGSQLIASNLKACKGNLRDAINMYNTGAKESVRIAPLGYVDKVIKNYELIVKTKVV